MGSTSVNDFTVSIGYGKFEETDLVSQEGLVIECSCGWSVLVSDETKLWDLIIRAASHTKEECEQNSVDVLKLEVPCPRAENKEPHIIHLWVIPSERDPSEEREVVCFGYERTR